MEQKQRKIGRLFLLIVLAAFNLVLWREIFVLSQSRFLKVVFFDVGQGSAVFLETPRRTQILVDGGPSGQILEKLNGEMPFFDRRIDFIISTHPDVDHLTGLVEVLKSYQVERVGWTGVQGQTAEFQEFWAETEKAKTVRTILKKGQRILVGQALALEVLAPLEDFEGREARDTNASSLALRASFGRDHFLLTGDLPVSVEKKLVQANGALEARVLQMGHHGSSSSSSDAFLEKVRPQVAVIQVGAKEGAEGPSCDNKERNRYGLPSCAVLERLKKYGIRILRTDEMGDIKLLTDGNGISLVQN